MEVFSKLIWLWEEEAYSTLRNRTSSASESKVADFFFIFYYFHFDSDYKYEFDICQERGKWIVQELFCDSKKVERLQRRSNDSKKNGDSSDVLSVESPSESPLNPPYESPVESRCLTATILLLFCNAEMLYGYSQASHIELFLLETSKNVYCNEAAIKVRPF